MSGNPLLKTGAISEADETATGLEPQKVVSEFSITSLRTLCGIGGFILRTATNL